MFQRLTHHSWAWLEKMMAGNAGLFVFIVRQTASRRSIFYPHNPRLLFLPTQADKPYPTFTCLHDKSALWRPRSKKNGASSRE